MLSNSVVHSTVSVVLLVLGLLLTPGETLAQSSPLPQACAATVFFGNGILTTKEEAVQTAIILSQHVNAALTKDNRDPLPDSCFTDAFAVSGLTDADDPSFWDFVFDVLESFGQIFTDVFSLIVQTAFADFDNIEYLTNPDLQAQVAEYRDTLGSTGKLIIVSHSQGNLFANEAFSVLTTGADGLPAIPEERIKIVAVATPQSFVAGAGEDYTTLFGDIISFVLTAKFPNTEIFGTPCPQVALPSAASLACHDFVKSYLTGSVSEPRIMGHILEAVPIVASNLAPTAGFTMTAGPHSATDGQTLNLLVPIAGSTVVDLSAARRSSDTDGNVVGWTWIIDGTTQASAGQTFSYAFTVGSHVVTLVVTDNQGAQSTPVQGTIVVSETTPPSVPTARDDAYTLTQGLTLTVPAPGVLDNDTVPAGVGPVVSFQTLPPGSLQNLGDGAFSYTPDPTFVGTVTFDYLFNAPTGSSNVARVTIQVDAPVLYSIIDLGDLPGSQVNSQAFAINDLGTLIVGRSVGAADADYSGCGTGAADKPFVWTAAGGMQALGPTPLLDLGVGVPFGPCGGVALGVNDQGEVVGHLDYGFAGRTRAFIWSAANGMQLIGAGQPGGAQDINNVGQVVGVLGAGAFRWTTAGGLESLAIPVQNTAAQAINRLGEVAGLAQIEGCGGTTRPVIWDIAGQPRDLDLTGFLASLAPYTLLCNAMAFGINDSANAVGSVHFVFASGEAWRLAFLSQNTSSQALGELPFDPQVGPRSTDAYDINNHDQIVGTSNGRAFRWIPQAGLEDLNSLLDVSGAGWTLLSASAINDAGQIVGFGLYNGELRAFLLTPTGIFPE